MERGQCPTVATWESGNVRSRKSPPSVTTPGQSSLQGNGGLTGKGPAGGLTGISSSGGVIGGCVGAGMGGVGVGGGGGGSVLGAGGRRQSILSVAWTDVDTGVERIMWREIDKVSRMVFPALFLVFLVLYWPILLMKTNTL